MQYIINYLQGIDLTVMTLPLSVYLIWGGTLLIILFIIVPLAVILLHRTLMAAQSIQHYMADMLAGGVSIDTNTSSVPALNDTITVASDMVKTAKALEYHSSAIGKVLAQRANSETNP